MSIFLSEILIKIFADYNLMIVALVIQIISSIFLCIIKPVAASKKDISQQEKSNFHRKVVVIITFFLVLSVVGMMIKCYSVIFAFSVGLLLSSVLLVVGKMQTLILNIKL